MLQKLEREKDGGSETKNTQKPSKCHSEVNTNYLEGKMDTDWL